MKYEYYIEDGDRVFFSKTKLSNGQTVTMTFSNGPNLQVGLSILSKRKHEYTMGMQNIECSTTGKCGLEGLIWAKKCLIGFEEYIKDNHMGTISLNVSWTDTRRKSVYIYGLTKLGYKIRPGTKYLYKTIICK